MNWFSKLANNPEHYYQIGHDESNDECTNYLWAWVGGTLQIEESMGRIHEQIWGQDVLFNNYTGRYDECANKISVGIPQKYSMRDVPNALLNSLFKQLSPDASIWSFETSPKYVGSGIQRVAQSGSSKPQFTDEEIEKWRQSYEPTYDRVGHFKKDQNKTNCKYFAYRYINNSLDIKKINDNQDNHYEFWGGNGLDDLFFGRYDSCLNMATITYGLTKGFDFNKRIVVPKSLLSMLLSKFGDGSGDMIVWYYPPKGYPERLA